MNIFSKILVVIIAYTTLMSCTNKEEDKTNASADCISKEIDAPKIAQPIMDYEIFIPKRIKDFTEIAIALEKYKKTNKQYPISKDAGKGWNGLTLESGEIDENWIPDLVPNFIQGLPRDPRQDKDPLHQYIYKSDGAHYKLIALNPDDCKYVKNVSPIYLDSRRAGCNYGIWTPNAKKWH